MILVGGRAVELLFGNSGVTETGVGDDGIGEVGSGEIGFIELGAIQVLFRKVRSGKVDSPEGDPRQIFRLIRAGAIELVLGEAVVA